MTSSTKGPADVGVADYKYQWLLIIPKKLHFESVQLLKESCLGTGSYGSVYKAECDGLMCAAKVLHPTLFTPDPQVASHRAHRLPSKRFEQECELLSAIQHPNVVQYLGTWTDPSTKLPVLLMELMDESLTHFLEKPGTPPLPFYIQVNICHDISLAVTFLHSNGIIHRDLSSNNILMIGDRRAKVTDFGMAKLKEFDHKFTETSTLCPGNPIYMPPEAVRELEVPKSSEKTDCFSFGVLCIQIITKLYPAPTQHYKEMRGLFKKYFELQSELKRRQNHLSLVPKDHPLLKTIQDCLKDDDAQRPSSEEVCHSIHIVKQGPKYIRSQENVCTAGQVESSTNTEDSTTKQRVKKASKQVSSIDNKSQQQSIGGTGYEEFVVISSCEKAVKKSSGLSPGEQLEADHLLMDLENYADIIQEFSSLVAA